MENIVHFLLFRANNSLNILFMYIFHMLNPLVIYMKNIFNAIISFVSLTRPEMKNISVKNSLKQTSQWNITKENVIKNYFTETFFNEIVSSVHTNTIEVIP